MPKIPVSWLIGACLFGIALVAGGAIFLVSYDVARRNTIDLLYDKARLTINTLTQRLGSQLTPIPQLMAGIESKLHEDPGVLNDSARISLLLAAASAGTPPLSGSGIIYSDSRLLRVPNLRTGEPPQWSNLADNAPLPDEIAAAWDMGRGHWGKPFYAQDIETTLFNYYLPVAREGRRLGLMIAAVSTSDLSRYIEGLEEDFSRSVRFNAFVLYGRDRVLAHRLLEGGYPGLSESEPLPRLGTFSDLILANLWNEVEEIPVDADRLRGVRLHRFQAAGDLYTTIYKPIASYGEEPILAGLYFRSDETRVELERLESIPRVVLGILFAALILSWVLGRLVSRPAKELAQAARAVGQFNLDAVPKIRDSRLKEMSLAGEAFNGMIVGLKLFEVYVPKRLVRRLMTLGDASAAQSDGRDLTVLFTDIAGYTKLSETLSSSQVADFLNTHFAILGGCVEAEEGTIDKYIGDALMAFWSAPEVQADAPARACRAALRIRAAIMQDNRERKAAGAPPVRVRIGIHKGPVVVGNIGFPGRVNYTIVGDSVNACQRLEALGKEVESDQDVTILVSREVVSAIGDTFELRHLGDRGVRGRAQPIDVFELLG